MPLFSKQTKQVLYGNLLVIIMLLGRMIFTQKVTYLFLLWNLFLAFLPLCAAIYAQKNSLKSWRLLIATAAWLAFFPNAPYLITDLYHLAHFKGMSLWYDAMMLFMAAFTGAAMGFISLQIMELQWRQVWQQKFFRRFSVQSRWRYRLLTIGLVFLLTGFGVYLGRVLRWNSWDVLTDTKGLAYDIATRIINPFEHKSTWGFTVIYAGALFFLYNVWCGASFIKKKNTGV